MRLSFGILGLALLFTGACLPAWGGSDPEAGISPKPALESGPVVFSPRSPLFAPLIGDPREPSVGMESYLDQKGFEASLGGTLDFLRWKSSPDMDWAWGIFAGLWTLSQNADLSGLEVDDWFSGTYLSEKTGPLSFRFEFQDQKSDLGQALFDSEKILLFTRDNFNLTVSLEALPGLRLYAGEGLKFPWDDFDRPESQSFSFIGTEVRTNPFAFLGDCRGYGTYHFKYQNQAGGTFDHAAQVGLLWGLAEGTGSSLRLALTYYTGHSEFGQFFQEMDQHWGIGIFYDP